MPFCSTNRFQYRQRLALWNGMGWLARLMQCYEGIVDDCDWVLELRHRNTMSATTSCSREANTVVKRMFAVQFHDGCLVVGSGSSKHAIWCEVLTSVIPVYYLAPNSTIVILFFLTPCGSQEEMNCRLDIVGIQD